MKIMNKIKLTMLMMLILGCLIKKENKVNAVKEKGYLKEHLRAEEIEELKNIIKNANIEKFEIFLNIHEDILKNYPIIVKVMKTEIEPEGGQTSKLIKAKMKYDFNKIIWKVMVNKGYDKKTIQRILQMKGKIKLPNRTKETITPLMAVAYYAPEIMAENLVEFTENGVDINEKNENRMTALMFAAMSIDKIYAVAAVKGLIKAGAQINEKELYKKTALHLASKEGQKEIVEVLLANEAKVDEKGTFGLTPLMMAAASGQKDTVKILLEAGAQVNEKAENGSTALMLAAHEMKKEVVEILLEAGAQANEKAGSGSTTLMIAAEKGFKEIVEILLKAGAKVDEKFLDGSTALMLAVLSGQKEVIEILLGAGAQVDVKGEKGITMLMIAAEKGRKEIVEILLKAGAKADEKFVDGRTALMLAAYEGHKDVVEILLGAGAKVDEKIGDGITALMLAVLNGHKEVAEILLKVGAKVDEKISDGSTALILAVLKGQKEVIEILLKAGAKVDEKVSDGSIALCIVGAEENEKFLDGSTALMLAILKDQKEIVQMLLGAGSQVNEKTRNRCTALMIAAYKGKKEIVEMLLGAGGQVNEKTEIGDTALMLAAYEGHKEVVEILLRAGADVSAVDISNLFIKEENTAPNLAENLIKLEIIYELIEAGAKVKQSFLDEFIKLTAEELEITDPRIMHKSVPIEILHKYCGYIGKRQLQRGIDNIIQKYSIKERLGELIYDIVSNMSKEGGKINIDVNLLRILNDYTECLNRRNAIIIVGQKDEAINIIDSFAMKSILVLAKISKKEIIAALTKLKEKWEENKRDIIELKKMKEEEILKILSA